MFHGYLDYFSKSPLGGRPSTNSEDHGAPNTHNHWFIIFYHVWGPAWIEIHWNSIWLRARSRMTSAYTCGSMTTLHDFGGVLGWPLDTFFWALTIPWSRLLACVRSGPYLWSTKQKLESKHKRAPAGPALHLLILASKVWAVGRLGGVPSHFCLT
jgi:hypothetical protein